MDSSHPKDPTSYIPHITVDSQIFTTDPVSLYVISSEILTPDSKITVHDTPMSVPHLDLSTEVLPTFLPSASTLVSDWITDSLKPNLTSPTLTLGSKTFTADSASQYIINHQTLSLDGHIAISGTSRSLASEAPSLASESKEEPFFSRFPMPSVTIGSKIYTANQASAYITEHQTLTVGAQITVDSTPVSISPQKSTLVVESKTQLLVPSFILPPITINSEMDTVNMASRYIIEGQTLTPGGQFSINGTPISLGLEASALVVESSTGPLSRFSQFHLPTLTINSKEYIANLGSVYVINNQTLTPGGQISVNGKVISFAFRASALVIGSTTESLLTSAALPSIKVVSKVYTMESASAYIINGQTLTAGGKITVKGTPVPLAPDASIFVIGGNTESLAATSPTIGLG